MMRDGAGGKLPVWYRKHTHGTPLQRCIAKNGGGCTQRGVAKSLKVPCLFMITEVSIRCQKNTEVGIRRIPPPQYTTVPILSTPGWSGRCSIFVTRIDTLATVVYWEGVYAGIPTSIFSSTPLAGDMCQEAFLPCTDVHSFRCNQAFILAAKNDGD